MLHPFVSDFTRKKHFCEFNHNSSLSACYACIPRPGGMHLAQLCIKLTMPLVCKCHNDKIKLVSWSKGGHHKTYYRKNVKCSTEIYSKI